MMALVMVLRNSNTVALDHAMGVASFTQAALDVFDLWNVTPAGVMAVYTDHTTWALFESTIDFYIGEYTGDTRRRVWTLGLTVNSVSLASVAGGAGDSRYSSVAAKILAESAGSDPIIIRLGHEHNGSSYPWNATGVETDYVAAFQHVVGLFRAVSARFRFDWNSVIAIGSPVNFAAYPGDAYVDVASFDVYWTQQHIDTHSGWFPGVSDPVQYWDYLLTFDDGINDLDSFAAAHGKPLAVPEWGSDQDDPEWVQIVDDWMVANNVAYHLWFDTNADVNYPTKISDDSQPALAQEWWLRYGVVPIFHDTFAGGLGSWVGSGTQTTSVVSGVAQVTGTTTAFTGLALRPVTGLTIGLDYRLVIDLDTDALNAFLQVSEAATPFGELGGATKNTAVLTRQELTFTASQTGVQPRIWPIGGDAGQVVRFDNAKLYLD